MTMESALEAPGGGYAGAPTGFRRLTPGLLQADRTAESFAGLPEGVTMPGQLLAAFKAAAPRLGLSPRLVHAVDWLFRFTQPQDWGRGGRPIVWPSASMQQEALGLSESRVKAINRALIEAGLITMKDSPNGKRYGKRDRAGAASSKPMASTCRRSPRATRSSCGWPRRRERSGRRWAGCAGGRRSPGTASPRSSKPPPNMALQGEEWVSLLRDSRDLVKALRKVERPEEMALGVESLERRQRAARERLEILLSKAGSGASEAVNSDPLGPENRPHQYTYKPSPDPEQDTVMRSWRRLSDRQR